MHFDLRGHHLEITTALRQYVSNKLERIERHFENVTDVQVILTVEKIRHKAESIIHVSGATIFAESVEDNMYSAIDSLADKLDRQVRKHKEKITDHHANQSQKWIAS
jgi:putative sigma-54 modulation protein